jgi:hypothetical protein
MSIKSMVVSAAIGLSGLSLSGCVYDDGPYYDTYGPYSARSAIVYDNRPIVRDRYTVYNRRYVSDRTVRRIYRPSDRYISVRGPGRSYGRRIVRVQ